MRRLLFLFLMVAPWALMQLRAEDAAEVHFRDKVKPLLESRCVSCHHADDARGNLRLDTRDAMLKGGDHGPAISLKEPGKSLLLQAVMHTKKSLQMPPKEKLGPEEIAVLERWIRDGAPWPSSEVVKTKRVKKEVLGNAWTDARNPVVKLWGQQRLNLWSMRPVKTIELPVVDWVPNPIDRFVLARLQEKGLSLSQPADRRTLARRLYYDLTGLPPSPQEMDVFLADTATDAYEKLVDRLLASPAFGEHWARLWLDVVRYSDSNGFDWDEFRPRAWRYRDYVIRSLNADKPYDQFITEQLAGDELVEGAPRSAREQDALIATGFLRIGPQDNSAPLFNEQTRARTELLSDLTETTGAAFLGLTYSCCRCHDHKFDPLLQADYYRLRAFFEAVKYADDKPIDLADEQAAITRHNREHDQKIARCEKEKAALAVGPKALLKALGRGTLPSFPAALLHFLETTTEKTIKSKTKSFLAKAEPSEPQLLAAMSEQQRLRYQSLTQQIAELKAARRSPTLALMMTDAKESIPATHILYQGDHRVPKDVVEPGYPSILNPNDVVIEKPGNPKTSGRRLTLAHWITSPDNPLTARVMVNRLWQGLFGKGLVDTPNDFGLSGSRPTHPELLDWLAKEFSNPPRQSQPWSIKRMIRLMVTSASYRQASTTPADSPALKVDAQNQLYWRQNPRRLSAEQLRDALLKASSSLIAHQGGPPRWPTLPDEVLQANPAFLDDNAEKTKGWYASPREQQNVRSIYLVQKRTVRLPLLETFDQPENTVSCARRSSSTVAPQALSLLNGTDAILAAQSLAQQTIKHVGFATEKQIDDVYRAVFQRLPTPSERSLCQRFLGTKTLTELCRVLLNTNEFVYRE